MENCTFSVEKCAFGVEECAFLATALVGKLLLLRVFGCAERSRRAPEPILWYGTFRFNDYPQ